MTETENWKKEELKKAKREAKNLIKSKKYQVYFGQGTKENLEFFITNPQKRYSIEEQTDNIKRITKNDKDLLKILESQTKTQNKKEKEDKENAELVKKARQKADNSLNEFESLKKEAQALLNSKSYFVNTSGNEKKRDKARIREYSDKENVRLLKSIIQKRKKQIAIMEKEKKEAEKREVELAKKFAQGKTPKKLDKEISTKKRELEKTTNARAEISKTQVSRRYHNISKQTELRSSIDIREKAKNYVEPEENVKKTKRKFLDISKSK